MSECVVCVIVSQLSSIRQMSLRPISSQRASKPFQSGLLPAKFGTKIAFVFAVTFSMIWLTEGTKVRTSTSQKTGVKFSWHKGATVVENVQAGVMTSSPGLSLAMWRARMFALLPLLQKMPYFFPKKTLTSRSNCAVRGPGASQPSRKQAFTALISSSPYASNLFGAYQIDFLYCDAIKEN